MPLFLLQFLIALQHDSLWSRVSVSQNKSQDSLHEIKCMVRRAVGIGESTSHARAVRSTWGNGMAGKKGCWSNPCFVFSCVCVPHWCWIALKWFRSSSFLGEWRCIEWHICQEGWKSACGIPEISGRFPWLSVCLQQWGWEEGKLEQLPPAQTGSWSGNDLCVIRSGKPAKSPQILFWHRVSVSVVSCHQNLLNNSWKHSPLGCIFRDATLSRKLVAAGQCKKCPNTGTRIYFRKFPGSARSLVVDAVITKSALKLSNALWTHFHFW